MKLRVLAAALLAALPTVATAQGRVPGVTDTEIVIGLTAPMSGPAAIYGNLALAKEAWARYVNDSGGVHGRKLKVLLKDDGFNPARAVANLKEMKDSVFLTTGLVGSAVANAARDEIAEARLPLVNAYASPQIWARQPRDKLKYVFISYPDYADEADYLVTFSVTRLGAQRLAVFYQNDDWGKEVMEGVGRAMKTLGGKASVAAAVPYEVSDRELGRQALKFRESGADTLFLAALNTHSANLVREMAKVGYRPRLVGSFTIGDYQVMYRLLGELWEGAYYAVIGAVPGDPETKVILDILMKYEPKLQGREATALTGAVNMIIVVEGLKKAGRSLTRDGFVEAMESIKGFTVLGLSAPVTFGFNHHHGLNAVRLMRAQKAADLSYVQLAPYQVFKPLF
ncbi:MAG TPA: ABC transporter substrate-binding protein [Candidatus Acidoferrales bacterium]|nr:ABC transporter substrate-binding protein [Candidatus Acidoferrales bacterium]